MASVLSFSQFINTFEVFDPKHFNDDVTREVERNKYSFQMNAKIYSGNIEKMVIDHLSEKNSYGGWMHPDDNLLIKVVHERHITPENLFMFAWKSATQSGIGKEAVKPPRYNPSFSLDRPRMELAPYEFMFSDGWIRYMQHDHRLPSGEHTTQVGIEGFGKQLKKLSKSFWQHILVDRGTCWAVTPMDSGRLHSNSYELEDERKNREEIRQVAAMLGVSVKV
jgi:hypothetical protein